MVHRNRSPSRWPWLSASTTLRWALSWLHTWSASGKRKGWRNFAQLMPAPTTIVVTPPATSHHPAGRAAEVTWVSPFGLTGMTSASVGSTGAVSTTAAVR